MDLNSHYEILENKKNEETKNIVDTTVIEIKENNCIFTENRGEKSIKKEKTICQKYGNYIIGFVGTLLFIVLITIIIVRL